MIPQKIFVKKIMEWPFTKVTSNEVSYFSSGIEFPKSFLAILKGAKSKADNQNFENF